jgi:hypothetical protein
MPAFCGGHCPKEFLIYHGFKCLICLSKVCVQTAIPFSCENIAALPPSSANDLAKFAQQFVEKSPLSILDYFGMCEGGHDMSRCFVRWRVLIYNSLTSQLVVVSTLRAAAANKFLSLIVLVHRVQNCRARGNVRTFGWECGAWKLPALHGMDENRGPPCQGVQRWMIDKNLAGCGEVSLRGAVW